jgi:hypothetical protein
MMEEDFYATIKLKTGEEIFSKVMPTEEDKKSLLILINPVQISEVTTRKGATGYKIEPWLKTTTEDIFILSMDDVITMSESKDIEIIMMHQEFSRKFNNVKSNRPNISRKMGYISNVIDAKEFLEKLYNNS